MKNVVRPREVRETHLRRAAIGYVRQSSDRQVRENQGSTADQRQQVEIALAWGWTRPQMQVIDDDLGCSGTTAVNRSGYQSLVAQIEAGRVGAVFVSDESRVGRDVPELMRFLQLCQIHDVLFVVDRKVYDLRDTGCLLTKQVLSLVNQAENIRRRDAMERGKLAKVHAGHTVSMPPAGYVRRVDGKWEKDESPLARESIGAVFAVFLEKRSTPATVKVLRERGIHLPRRDKDGNLRWVDPKIYAVGAILKNAVYTGDYHYRRQRVDHSKARTPSGVLRRRKALPEETLISPDRHEPYVSKEDWDQIQRVLALNAPSQEHRNLGPGAALVQGILWCDQHQTRVMNPAYHARRRDGDYSLSYVCMGDYVEGGDFCWIVCGRAVDRAVARAALARLRPDRLDPLRAEWERLRATDAGHRRRHDAELHQARRRADRLRELIVDTDKTLTNVIEDHERQLEINLVRISQLEREGAAAHHPADPVITKKMWAELVDFYRNANAVFHAPTTTHRDRKEIIRTLVKAVMVEERTDEEIRLRIVWQDGSPDQPVAIKQVPWMHRIMLEMADAGEKPENIAAWLNDRGHVNLQGKPWTRLTVHTLIWRKRRQRSAKNRTAA